MNDFGLYVVMTSPVHISYEKLAECCVQEGVAMLQLRDKMLEDKQRLALALRIASITRGSLTKFIVNDRADIALACSADGVHLGQDDLPIEKVRQFAKDLIVGVSTHTHEQAADAILQNPDYMAFGPVYATPAKNGRDAVTGTAALTHAARQAKVPLVAIGGIDETNIAAVVAAGARNIALIRAVDKSNATAAIRRLKNLIADTLAHEEKHGE